MKETDFAGIKLRLTRKNCIFVSAAVVLILIIILRMANQPSKALPADASWSLGQYCENSDEALTRGMMAMTLYALENAEDEAVGFADYIADVDSGSCYYKAVHWAVSNGIMTVDADGNFLPHAAVSRENMLCALMRFSEIAGFETDRVSADMSVYRDADSVSKYAKQAVRWAVGTGITVGCGNGMLYPQTKASCAQLTAALVRLYGGKMKAPKWAEVVCTSDGAENDYLNNVKTVSFLSVGDNLYHDAVISSGEQSNGTLDYSDIYSEISGYVQKADLASINQETIFVSEPSMYSGYPNFGTPYAVADAVADAGFDIVTQASNHTLDKGVQSVFNTVAYWRTEHPEITLLGIHDTQESRVKIVEKNGIRIAMLCYCYGLNGMSLPTGSEFAIDTLALGETAIAADMAEAEQNADCTIVFMHAGTEYVYDPDGTQTHWAQFFADHGAEAIIGTHPHVLQPLEYIQSADGRQVPCFYSLGNLVSNQQEFPRWLGGMAQFDIIMDGNRLTVENVSLSPTFTHIYSENGTSFYKAYLLTDYGEELAAQHQYGEQFRYDTEEIRSLFRQITGE